MFAKILMLISVSTFCLLILGMMMGAASSWGLLNGWKPFWVFPITIFIFVPAMIGGALLTGIK